MKYCLYQPVSASTEFDFLLVGLLVASSWEHMKTNHQRLTEFDFLLFDDFICSFSILYLSDAFLIQCNVLTCPEIWQ